MSYVWAQAPWELNLHFLLARAQNKVAFRSWTCIRHYSSAKTLLRLKDLGGCSASSFIPLFLLEQKMRFDLSWWCLRVGFRNCLSIVWCHPLKHKSQFLCLNQTAHTEHCVIYGSGVWSTAWAWSTAWGTDLDYFPKEIMLLARSSCHLRNIQLLQTTERTVRNWFWEAVHWWRSTRDKFL